MNVALAAVAGLVLGVVIGGWATTHFIARNYDAITMDVARKLMAATPDPCT